ncbi:MAG: GldG family protein, partial [Verrucomicrobiota bacterium]
MSSKSKHSSGLFYSLIGVILVLAIVLVVNRIVGASGAKLDLTEKGLYTLSDGTKNILSELETPITLRFYATKDSELVGPDDKAFIRRIGDLLKEYRKAAPSGKVKLEFIDPEPFSEEVDDARYNGMRPFVSSSGEEVFRGLTIEQLEERFAIPLIQRGNEPMLEYDISRAISRFGDKELPVIGLMTDLALRGYTPPRNPQQPFMQQQQQQGTPPWLLYEELQRDYRVREFGTTSAQKIGEEVKALVIVHPNSIVDEVEYEIDQYLLRGGSIIAFLDSFSELSQMPPQTGNSSSLPKLLPAWGWTFEPADVVVDSEYGAKVAADVVQPAILRVPRAGINKDGGPVTDQLQSVDMIYTGAFYPEEEGPEGVKKEILMQSSTSAGTSSPFALQNYMRELQTAFQGGQKLDAFDFDATGNTYVLGLRLTGSFNTAFPDGRPGKDEEGSAETGEEGKAEEEKPVEDDKDHLKESVQDSAVILFADSDMLY